MENDGAWVLVEIDGLDEGGRVSGYALGRRDLDNPDAPMRPQLWADKEAAEYWLDSKSEPQLTRDTHAAVWLNADNIAKYTELIGGFGEFPIALEIL